MHHENRKTEVRGENVSIRNEGLDDNKIAVVNFDRGRRY